MCPLLYQKIFLGMSRMGWWLGTIKGSVNAFWETHKHFKDAKIINFDIIHRHVWGEEIPSDLLKSYLTVNDNAISEYPTNDQDNSW